MKKTPKEHFDESFEDKRERFRQRELERKQKLERNRIGTSPAHYPHLRNNEKSERPIWGAVGGLVK